IGGVVAALIYLPGYDSSRADIVSAIPHDLPAVQAEIRSYEQFELPLLTRVAVVQRKADGLSAEAQARAVARAVQLNLHQLPGLERIAGALPVTNALGLFPSSREQGTTIITYLLFEPDVSPADQVALAHEFVRRYVNDTGDGAVGVTGAIALRRTEGHVIVDKLPWVELASVGLVLVVVGLAFRSVVAPFVVLLPAALAFLLATRAIGLLSGLPSVTVPRELRPMLTVLVLGIMADYGIFYLSAFRSALRGGAERGVAARRAVRHVTPIVFTAAFTIAATSMAVLLARLELFNSLGPGMAVTVLVGGLMAITAIPALMGLLGEYVFWPSRPGAPPGMRPVQEKGHGLGGKVGRLTANRPLAFVLVFLGFGLLIAGPWPLRGYRVGLNLITDLPSDTEPVRAAHAAAAGFNRGIVAPTEVVVEQPGIARDEAALARLQQELGQIEGVAGVVGPGFAPLQNANGVLVAKSGDAARYVLVLTNEPYGPDAIATVSNIQGRAKALLEGAGLPGASLRVAGDTAISAQLIDRANGDLVRVSLGILAIDLIILVVFLRALIAPLLLLASSALTVLTSLGLTVWVFQNQLGYDSLTYYVPFAVAVLLVSFGTDYTLFMVGRVWEDAERESLPGAIARAGRTATPAISLAGLMLGLSFALLVIIPLTTFRQFALAMLAGILIDTFFVQSIVVPAMLSALGKLSGWPGRRFTMRGSRWRRDRPARL
ncbi:MAG: MMPL family transporter, partial [Dehalococcoidia bacterium]|nr:MMPL family transporter [Dehalococcoidia bacterium]